MANNKRLLGQSTFFKLIRDGAVANIFNAVVDFSFTDNLEVLDEGFLGETTNRKDSVYNGTDFSMTAQMFGASESELRDGVIAKARRLPGAVNRIDVAFTMAFPSGESRLVTLLDCEFGNIEWSSGARAEAVTSSWEGSCSSTQTLPV